VTRRLAARVVRRSVAAFAFGAILSCGDSAPTQATTSEEPAALAKATGPSVDAFRFVDATDDSGLVFVCRGADVPNYIPEAKGAGVAMFDQDGDGVLDLVVAAGSTVEREARDEGGFGVAFYRGLGGLRFEDRTKAVGLDVELPWVMAPVAADVDGDGRVDLLLTSLRGLRLFRNEGARFRDVTNEALPRSAREPAGWCTSAVFADLDGDGDLDLFVCRYLKFDPRRPPKDGVDGRSCLRRGKPVLCGPRGLDPLPDLVLRNRGAGVFEDATEALGFSAAPPAYGLGATLVDVDGDGVLEVFVANDATPNHVFRRGADGRYVERGAATGLAWSADGAPEAGMGVDVADLNLDGVDDVVVTNFEGEPNDVYLSNGALGHLESSGRVKTAAVDRPRLGFGVGIRDFDGDGLLDVFVANGHVYPDDGGGSAWRQPATLHLGRPDGTFVAATGPSVSALDVPRPARAAAFGDLDDDGDVDVVLIRMGEPPALLRCDLPSDLPWVGVEVRADGRNPFAIGAEVALTFDGVVRKARVRPHASFMATNDARLVFRLPKAPTGPIRVEATLGDRRGVAEARIGAYATVRIDASTKPDRR
jgi:enediyne biosynthesis protein E4